MGSGGRAEGQRRGGRREGGGEGGGKGVGVVLVGAVGERGTGEREIG